MKKYVPFCISLSLMLAACAGSSNDAEAAERARANAARMRANSAYDTLDETTGTGKAAKAETKTNDAPVQNAPVAKGVKTVQGNLLLALQNEACPNLGDFRGIGIAENIQAARLAAQKDIGAQIQSSVTAETRSVASSNTDAEGKMTHAESISQNIKLNTHLENAQDAKAIATLYNGDQYGVFACMSKADAAKPFLMDYKVLQDSLKLVTQAFAHQVHPMEKQRFYERGQDLFLRYRVVKNFLNSLESPAGHGETVEGDFALMQDSYTKFRSEYAIFFSANESEYADAVFEKLSKLVRMQKAECTAGLCLNAEIGEVSCKEGSLGISCQVDVALSGSSVNGETFFSMKTFVKGSGRYEESEALEKLEHNLKNGDWADGWKQELDKWNLK